MEKKNDMELGVYGEITVRDIVNAVTSNPKLFPNGMDTKIASGDIGLYNFHREHVMQHEQMSAEVYSPCLFLGYEMFG